MRRLHRLDRGNATAELAVALPGLLLLVLFGLGAVDAAFARLQCLDAARDAALASARGDDGFALGVRRAPRGARVSVHIEGGMARAVVTFRVSPLGPHLPAMTVGATVAAPVEPGPP